MSPIKEDHNMKKTMSKVTEKTTFTWEDLLEKLLEIFETDEVNIKKIEFNTPCKLFTRSDN
jgi:hypothetical protein